MCEGTVIPIEREVELLGVVVGSKLKFEGHISKICKKTQSTGCRPQQNEKDATTRNS